MMANIHITLVGGQTTPVYQGIIAANPDRVILIYSDQTENEANRIYAEIEVDCELKKFDPVDLKKINAAVLALKNSFTIGDRININIGGGTKPWSLLFFEHFRDEANAGIVYIDQNNRIWDLKSHQSCEVEFDMDIQFRLLGNELKKYQKLDGYTDEDKKQIKEIRELRQFNYQDYLEIIDYLSRYRDRSIAIAQNGSGSVMTWKKTDKCFEVVMRQRNGQMLRKTLKSEHIRNLVLNSGWFEFEIAIILAGWDKSKQIRMNCIFPTKNGSPKNEIDLIINTGSKLLFVECKTQIKNETDIDKFASAVKVYGGLGSKALFVTDAAMTEKAQEKCADHGIMIFCLQHNVLNLPVEGLLFKMLDSELFNINAK
jgi:hypothetical protein